MLYMDGKFVHVRYCLFTYLLVDIFVFSILSIQLEIDIHFYIFFSLCVLDFFNYLMMFVHCNTIKTMKNLKYSSEYQVWKAIFKQPWDGFSLLGSLETHWQLAYLAFWYAGWVSTHIISQDVKGILDINPTQLRGADVHQVFFQAVFCKNLWMHKNLMGFIWTQSFFLSLELACWSKVSGIFN